MKLTYVKSQSSVKPELVDNTSSRTMVYLRKNIVETEMVNMNDDSSSSTTFYEYDEAKLTKEEYREYLRDIETQNTLQTIEDLKTENQTLNEQVTMLTDCLLEMSEMIYA